MPLPNITEHDWDSIKINYGDTTAFITKFDQQQDWIQTFGEESNIVGEAIEEWVNNPVDMPISVEAGGDGVTTFSIWHQWSKATAEIAGDKDEALSLIGAAGNDELAAITLEGSARYDAITLAGSDAVDAIEAAGAFWNPDNYYTSDEVDDIISGLDIGDGTVTSVSGTGTVAGLSLSGTVTTTGNITLGGSLSVDLTTMVTGDLPFANLAQGSALSVLGVTGNSTADVASIAAGTDHQVMRRSGTAVAFGAVNLAQSAAVTGRLPFTNVPQLAALSVLGVTGNSTADMAGISAGTDHQVLRRSGTAVAFGSINLAQSAAVTGTLGVTNGGTGVTTSTGSGNNVLSTSPALTTPTITNQTVTNYTETTSSSSGNTTVNLANGTIFRVTTTGSNTITLPSSSAGKSFVVILVYGGTHTPSFAGGSTIKWPGGAAPSLASTSGKISIFGFFQDGTNTYGSTYGQEF